MRKLRKNQKEAGITLVALIITIIILIILAAVAIQALFKENFIDVAIHGTQNYAEGQHEEAEMFRNLDEKLSKAVSKIENAGLAKVYAKLYKKNGSEEEVLILASSEEKFSDYSNELTILAEFGNIYEISFSSEEDLYQIPEYAELLQSDEWEEYKKTNPEEAKLFIQEIIAELNTKLPWIPWLTDIEHGEDYTEYVNIDLVEVRILDEIFPTSTSKWFNYCVRLQNIRGIEKLNTTNVVDMSEMFFGCGSLTELDLRSFNTTNVVDMSGMFMECTSLTKLDLRSFNTTNVVDMSGMFMECTSLTKLDLRSFNTTNVTNMNSMFNNCISLTESDLSKFNTSNVTTMFGMFANCSSLTKLDLRSFNTTNVVDMQFMFYGCSSLTKILVGVDWVYASDTRFMFNDCGVSDVTRI